MLEIYKKARDIWNKAASKSKLDLFSFEIEFYKKMLNIFHVGNYYYAIFNYETKDFEFISNDVEKISGYGVSEYSVPFLIKNIHPDDYSYFLNFENRAMDFLTSLPVNRLMKYKIRHDYRIKKKDGNYARLLQQGIVIEHDQNGGIMRTLIVHTDITHLKPNGKPLLSFIGLDGEPSYHDVAAEQLFLPSKDVLTKREKQVLSFLIEGKLSKEVGQILNISKQTVDKHRKNMLRKNNVNNTNELIAKAIKESWL